MFTWYHCNVSRKPFEIILYADKITLSAIVTITGFPYEGYVTVMASRYMLLGVWEPFTQISVNLFSSTMKEKYVALTTIVNIMIFHHVYSSPYIVMVWKKRRKKICIRMKFYIVYKLLFNCWCNRHLKSLEIQTSVISFNWPGDIYKIHAYQNNI